MSVYKIHNKHLRVTDMNDKSIEEILEQNKSQVIILRGLPGVGKTNLCKIIHKLLKSQGTASYRINMMEYFRNSRGVLQFNKDLREESERWFVRSVATAISEITKEAEVKKKDVLIIDDFNVTCWDYCPIYRLADAIGGVCPMSIELTPPIKEILAAGEVRPGVSIPRSVITGMADNWFTPPRKYSLNYWNIERIVKPDLPVEELKFTSVL